MAGARKPGPTCFSRSDEHIDAGTLCRQRSHAPGPLGANARKLAGRAKSSGAHAQCEKKDDMNKDMELSSDGLDFIYDREAMAGVSDKLHWPQGGSGVTLGAGYDMKYRTRESVERDLVGIGLDKEKAKKASAGAGKAGNEAKKFAEENKSLFTLTKRQEKDLLEKTVTKYEEAVRKYVKVKLNQNQYAALVSAVYNIGEPAFKSSTLLEKLNKCDYEGAAKEFLKWNKSDGKVVDGLTKRRKKEKDLFSKPVRGTSSSLSTEILTPMAVALWTSPALWSHISA